MAESVKKFVPRAPRYKIRPVDNQFFRYAKEQPNGKSFTTQIIDLSATGMAFMTSEANAPHIGERIKVEIPLRGDEQIAWFARTVRIESFSSKKWWMDEAAFKNSDQVLVAIEFENLPEAHQERIQSTIEYKFAQLRKEKRVRSLNAFIEYSKDHLPTLLLYGGSVIFTIFLLWFLSQPSENYDAEKGAPWGQRYPSLNIFSPDEPNKEP